MPTEFGILMIIHKESWPEGYMMSMGIKKGAEEYGDSIAVMTYMNYDEFKPWEKTPLIR